MSIDRQAFENLRALANGDRRFLDEILHLFDTTGGERIDFMEALFKCAEYKACAAGAHSLKSSSLVLGATTLADLCGELEEAEGRARPGLFEEMREAYGSSCRDLRALTE